MLKHILVLAMVAIVFYNSFIVQPKINEIFAKFLPDTQPQEEVKKQFFSFRTTRKKWCKVCFVLAILVLAVTPILRFF